MVNEPIYTLRSIESEVARPSVLTTGSLPTCLAELAEAILNDVTASNHAVLRITAQHPDERAVEILTVRVTGDNA